MIGAGGVAAGVNPALTVSELKHHLAVTGTKYLIVHETCSKNITQAAAECGIRADSVYLFDDDLLAEHESSSPNSSEHSDDVLPDARSDDYSSDDDSQRPRQLKDLVRLGWGTWLGHEPHEPASSAVHATTSGTTGLPKAAIIPQRYLVSQSVMLEDQYASREGKVRSRAPRAA